MAICFPQKDPIIILYVSAFCRDLDEHLADITILYNNGIRDDRPPGTEATYDCHTGNTLHGEAVRRCQDDGTWSGIAPTCQRKSINASCT